MAVYKLFPDKDATIVSNFPIQNQGRDEILEIGTFNGTSSFSTSPQGELPAFKRSLIQFNSTEISNVLSSKVGSNDFSASLKLYLANAEGIPLDYKIFTNLVIASPDVIIVPASINIGIQTRVAGLMPDTIWLINTITSNSGKKIRAVMKAVPMRTMAKGKANKSKVKAVAAINGTIIYLSSKNAIRIHFAVQSQTMPPLLSKYF